MCSDKTAAKKHQEDLDESDIAVPVTRDAAELADLVHQAQRTERRPVIVTTYHSSEKLAEAQQLGMGPIGTAIADEAHCTATATEDESYFRLIHNRNLINAKRRVYMTATPRIWSPHARRQAKAKDIDVLSMDDQSATYGPVLYDLPFAKAVEAGMICDIRLTVLKLDRDKILQEEQVQDLQTKLGTDTPTTVKLLGVRSALRHRKNDRNDEFDERPLRRTVWFVNLIKDSKEVKATVDENEVRLAKLGRQDGTVEIIHVDGTQPASVRRQALERLREPIRRRHLPRPDERAVPHGGESTSRRLTESWLLKPKKDQRDMVQAIGRTARKAPGEVGRAGGHPAHRRGRPRP